MIRGEKASIGIGRTVSAHDGILTVHDEEAWGGENCWIDFDREMLEKLVAYAKLNGVLPENDKEVKL